MNDGWKQFLISEGAQCVAEDSVYFSRTGIDRNNVPSVFITPLPSLSLLEITGKDAGAFLHGQFTSDIAALPSGGRQFSAWCDPKGKVIATFFLYRSGESYLILLPAVQAENFMKRMRGYVLRSEVNIHQPGEDDVTMGIYGETDVEKLSPNGDTVYIKDSIFFLSVPGPGVPRGIAMGPSEKIQSLWNRLKSGARPAGSDHWYLTDIKTGIPWLTENTSGQFLPQELNLEELGGLSYTKGCYPGQEIIARLRYRGKLKQRLYRATVNSESPPGAGMKLYGEETEQDLGTVLLSVTLPEKRFYLLVTANTEYAVHKSVHLQDQNGPVLEFET